MRARVLALKSYARLAQVCGITNIVFGLLNLIPQRGQINWPGAILCLAIGIPATVASSMYNPCACCPCDSSGSSRVKTIAILCIVAAVAALAGTITCAAIMAQVASWPLPKQYYCCPPDAKEITMDSCGSDQYGGFREASLLCSSPASPVDDAKKKYDCVAGGPYPPYVTKEEPMTCFQDRVPVETKLESGSLKVFRAIHNYVKTVLGIGIGVGTETESRRHRQRQRHGAHPTSTSLSPHRSVSNIELQQKKRR